MTRNASRQVPQITSTQARKIFDTTPKVVFVDVRSRFAFDEAHIRNAVSLPLDAIQAQWQALTTDQDIIIYSDSPDDTADEEAAEFLRNKGFKKMMILADGFAGWDDAGFPTAREEPSMDAFQIRSDFTEAPS